MKSFINLVKNESLKLWGQKSFRVLLIIIGVILVLTPFVRLTFDSALSGFDTGDPVETYKNQADSARESGDELRAAEYDVYYEVELYFKEKGFSRTSAEYSLYYTELLNLSLTRSSLELISSGKFTPEQLEKMAKGLK